MGAESKLKVAGGSGKENTRPRRVPQRQVEPPTPETSPSAGRVVCLPVLVPPGFSPRGCKGRSPLHEITLVSPFPVGEGSGGLSFPFGEGGQKSKLKAG